MSAWIVTEAHIDVLVLAGVQFGVPYDEDAVVRRSGLRGPADLTAAGAELWAENHRSVNHRYDEDSEPPSYRPPAAEVILDPVAVVKAIDCYVYQSCEHPGWTGSLAADYCRRLRAAVMTGLPATSTRGDRSYPAGWDAAPWGIEHLTQAAATLRAGGGR